MKKHNLKTFKINDDYQIVCHWENTRYGFRHLASLKDKYYQEICKAKQCYYNRTWESFEYETVINDLLTKAKIMPEEQIKEFLECCRKDNLEEVNKQFGFIAGIAKIGEILCETQAEKNDWKERMIKAGLGNKGLIMPDDWITLSEDEKEKRLNNVIKKMEEK